jgi:hypothetical protein
VLGQFATVDDAGRAYDAEVRWRGWAHIRPLNFPQPEEQAAYAQAGERCDERGLPLSLAPNPYASTQCGRAFAVQGAPAQRPQMSLSTLKPGKSGFFGVSTSSTASKVGRCRFTPCCPWVDPV